MNTEAYNIKLYDSNVIEQITSKLIDQYKIFQGYTRIVELANLLGMKVKPTLFNDDNVAGMLKFENNEINIYINEYQSVNRQRFTIAHEIGHYILHRDLVANQKTSVFYRKDFNNFKDPIEAQANRFAASILMPQDMVKGLYKLQFDADSIANILKVSTTAMSFRIMELGLINE